MTDLARRSPWQPIVAASLLLAAPRAVPAQGHAPADPRQEVFIAEARAAAADLADPSTASRLGYRLLGPDFPGMGEHWVHPGRIVSGDVDPRRPSVISYTRIDGRHTLLGVAYALPLSPGEEPPEAPFGKHVWHDHASSVDEETVLLNSVASLHGHGSGHRLSMVHVWTHVPNPDGILEQNNWALPFLREGLPVPEGLSASAARGLSLSGEGRTFYRELIRRTVDVTEPELKGIERALDRHASRAEAVARAAAESDPREVDQRRLEDLWRDLWGDVRAVLRDARWDDLSGFVDGR